MNPWLRITVLSSWPISCLVKCPKLFCVSSKSQASIVKRQRQICIGCFGFRLTHVAQPQRRICAGPLLSLREFHTSQPRFAGPLAVLLLKLAGPFSKGIKLAAVVGGRSLRKSWRKLSQHQRLHWSRRLAVLLGGFGGTCVGFYFFHLEETPVTNRNGQIFMFTGMLKVLHNADSLAVVLGHEMSHVVLQHAAEKVSLHGFINMLLVISCALVWAVLPSDLLAIGAHWLQNMILAILLHLPYSRKLEEEADEVGMNMAAKACFDVRESPKLWRQLALAKNNNDEAESPTWLSSHPTHNDRADKLEGLLPKALKIREDCKCPPLNSE